MGNEEAGMNARAALEEIGRVSRRVRSKGRWAGWVWLAIAVATPAFLIGTHATPLIGLGSLVIAIAFGLLGVGLALWESRRPVVGKEAAEVDRPMTWAYVATMVAVSIVAIVADPEGPPGWWIALSFLPSAPALVAAWRILRA